MQSSAAHEVDCSTISAANQENPGKDKPTNSSSSQSLPTSPAPTATSHNLKPAPLDNKQPSTLSESASASESVVPNTNKSIMASPRACSNNEAATCANSTSENTLSKPNISASSDILPLADISSTENISCLSASNIENIDTFSDSQSLLSETDADVDLNVVIFTEFKNAVSNLLVFLKKFNGHLKEGRVVQSDHQGLIDELLACDLCVESPRFFKMSKNVPQNPFDDLNSKKLDQNKLHTVNLKKTIDNLQKSEKIMHNYQSKITKLRNSTNSDDIYLKKRNRLIEFSIFLSFKLFKLDILEYFLYLRDCVNPYHFMLNINKVYQTVYEVIFFLDLCSKTVVGIKNDPFFVQNSEKISDSISVYKNFKSSRPNFLAKLNQLCEFEKHFMKNNGKAVFISLNTDHPITNALRFNKSRIEVLVVLMLNYHIRYLSLIEKFVKDNAGSSMFRMNLLPTNTSTNNFESLVNFIRKKFNTNILSIKNSFYALNELFLHEGKADDVFGNVKYCMRTMDITMEAMKIFNNSYNYLAAVTPLFPSVNNSSTVASLRNSLVHQSLIKSQGKIGKSRYSFRKRYQLTNQNIQSQHAPTNAPKVSSNSTSTSGQQRPSSINASYLSSSWFITDDLKKKFDDLLLVKFAQNSNLVTKAMHLDAENIKGDLDVLLGQFCTLLNGALYQRFHFYIGEIDASYADLVYSIDNEDNFSTLSNFLFG